MLKEKLQERKRIATAQVAQINLQTGFEDSVVWQKPLPLFQVFSTHLCRHWKT